ncbi:epidermal growth factor receptor kinase substrate 8-like protein 3 isoform X1 [Gadus morhua]|uniref:epidermal growth factor receptor kinase substrate 8-like protein 3 isoform X1 n=1 Tax=Gadus morhua TaxID=8049 RepID=UPI0011B8135D|nr:epidermal growth factor receptor kinase substrate 8-like protein 3 isoform X1 [Gadus morhua]
MSGRSSPFGNNTNSYAGSIQSDRSGNSDDGSQVSNLSRPSARSIYSQRKEYASSINKILDKFQYRVEHLITCELDGKELQGVADCVERLNLLEGMGRVWGQNMFLEVRGSDLHLCDIETREELESLPLNSIVELRAVMDSEVYHSLLTMCVKVRRTSSVFLFQCDELKADFIKKDLSRALLRSQKENYSGPPVSMVPKHQIRPSPAPQPRNWNPPEDPVSTWSSPDYGEESDAGTPVPPREEYTQRVRERTPSPQPSYTSEEELPQILPYTERDRNVDILNHIFTDLEIFMGQIAASEAKHEKKNKKKWKKKTKKKKALEGMPPVEEFFTCLQKIKFGFNLLPELNGKISDPSASDFVHNLFTTLAFVHARCPPDLSSTVVAPLLTPECFRLLSEEANPEEDALWQSLGDPWNIPSTKWPEDDDDIPTYTLAFLDGWQPPEVSKGSPAVRPAKRKATPRPAPAARPAPAPAASPAPSPAPRPGPSQKPAQRKPPPPSQRQEEPEPRHMRVVYDFTARNAKELSITKGEIVNLLDSSKKWWKVRNTSGEQGFIPNNVLEPLETEPSEINPEMDEFTGPPVLTKKSKPKDVTAWLEYRGFSRITVRCLGPLSGSMLLGMSREELKKVCPEEGGRVFFQLQSVKSSLALESEMRKASMG